MSCCGGDGCGCGGPGFNRTADEIWQTCEEKGFHEPVDIGTLDRALRLLLIVGEVSEAIEALRKEPEKHDEEIADVMIRLLHYAAVEDIDLDAKVAEKMAINKERPHKHGKAF